MNKKKIFSVLIAFAFVLGVMAFANPAHAVMRHYVADVTKILNYKSVPQKISDTVTYKVLAVGSNTSETIYSTQAKASMTNPVTTTVFATLDRIDFWCDPTDATNDLAVDLIVTDTDGGFTAFVEDFTPSMRTVEIDERPNVMHHGVIWFGVSSNVATDTGIVFAPKTAVEDVAVEVITADSGMTLSVGTSDTAAGFRTAVSMTSTGFIADTGVITGGSTIDYVPATNYGSLLTTAISGSDAVATVGGNSKKWHFVNAAGTDDDLYYTGSAGSDTAVGYIHYFFTRLR
jgi:hypothetical protein